MIKRVAPKETEAQNQRQAELERKQKVSDCAGVTKQWGSSWGVGRQIAKILSKQGARAEQRTIIKLASLDDTL